MNPQLGEAYDSYCEAAQALIEKLNDDSIILSPDEVKDLTTQIEKIHKAISRFN